jgi:hypothetical protein
MNEMKPISNFKNNLYKVAIILLLAYAAFSSAMKDLDRLQEVAGNVHAATADGLGSLAKVYSATKSLTDTPEVARAEEVNAPETPRVDIVAAGASVALTGFDQNADDAAENLLRTKTHNAASCPLRKRESVDSPKATFKDMKWNAVAQLQKRDELLRRELPVAADGEVASLLRREPRLRAFIKKLPAAAGKTKWSNVSEFKSLGDVISFGFKAAKVEEAQIERHVQRVEAGDDASHQVFEFKRGADSERDELEMHQ